MLHRHEIQPNPDIALYIGYSIFFHIGQPIIARNLPSVLPPPPSPLLW